MEKLIFRIGQTLGAIPVIEATDNLLAIAGVHAGCLEVLGGNRVRSVHDMKGKKIAIGLHGGSDHIFLATLLGYIGMDPRKDVTWIEAGSACAPY